LPIYGITTKTQLPSGKSRSVYVSYKGQYAGSGLVDSVVESGFTSADGSRTTRVAYQTLDNGILDKPQSISVYDTFGSQVARTDYGYDQSSVTGTSSPQHIGISGSRGNLTTVTRWTSGSSSLSSTYTYYDTGLVRKAYAVNSTTSSTSYTYGYCGNSFPSSVTGPTGLTAQATWGCTGGVQLTATDANGNVSSSTYTDPYFWRPSSSTDAAQNSTNYTYTSASSGTPASVESSMAISGSSGSDVLTTLDPFGRTLTSQVRQAPGSPSFDTIGYAYDSLGRISFTSLPYSASAGQATASGPGQSMSYDALSRVVGVSDAGGGFKTVSYPDNDVLVTRGPAPNCENSKQRQNEYDGFGRLTSVCELTSGTGSGSCSQSSPQTGYWTKYTYNALGNIVGVAQNAQAASQQTRSFTYDWLGRLTSEINPENGSTHYTYDSDASCGTSPGDLVKKVDAMGNVTCIAYDLLHRPTKVSYPSGPYSANTPTKNFVYDAATVGGVTMANAKGRLAEAYTGTSPSSAITDIGFSYSVRGETTGVWEKTPHSNGYSHVYTTGYWANGLPMNLSGIPSVPAIAYSLDGEGRPNSVNAGSSPLLNSVMYNPASQVTGLQYGSGDMDNFLFDPNTGRMISYQYQLSTQTPVTGSLKWNPDGSLGVLAIADPFNAANSQTCTYGNDDLGRIAKTNCVVAGTQTTLWQQKFSLDPFGNISKFGSNGVFPATYSTSTNWIASGITATYDSNGNITTDGQHQYSWDAGGNLASVDTINVTFDALGRAAEQANSGSYTQILYAPWGDKIALVNGGNLQKAFIPLLGGAKAVYTSTGLTYYRHPDWLGSSRFASTHTQPTTVYYSGAYAPYGESYSETGTTDRSFTGQNQDTVAGIYDFPTRGYSPAQGRWLSPDKAGLGAVNPAKPQSWNRYAYVHNKPLRSVDPLGQDAYDLVYCGDCGSSGDSLGYSGSGYSENDGGAFDAIGDFFEGIGDFFSGLFSGGGSDHRSPPAPSINYAQSSASSSAARSISNGTGSSVSVNGDPGIPSPANNGIGDLVQSLFCSAFSGLVNAASPQNLNSTIGLGAGGSAGVGWFFGVAGSAGVQAVADSHGNLGIAFNAGGNPGYGVYGLGATGGVQGSYSTASSIYDLRGYSLGGGVTAGPGGVDVSASRGGTTTVTGTLGVGGGTKGAALSVNHTWVPNALSTNCR